MATDDVDQATPAMNRRQFIRRAIHGALGLSVVATIAACGARREQERRLIKITSQNQLEPASLTIRKGVTVLWQNVGELPQTATCDPSKAADKTRVSLPPGAQPWDSGVLYPGQSWAYTFQTPGTYLFFSRTQDTPSMMGVIQVTE